MLLLLLRKKQSGSFAGSSMCSNKVQQARKVINKGHQAHYRLTFESHTRRFWATPLTENSVPMMTLQILILEGLHNKGYQTNQQRVSNWIEAHLFNHQPGTLFSWQWGHRPAHKNDTHTAVHTRKSIGTRIQTPKQEECVAWQGLHNIWHAHLGKYYTSGVCTVLQTSLWCASCSKLGRRSHPKDWPHNDELNNPRTIRFKGPEVLTFNG